MAESLFIIYSENYYDAYLTIDREICLPDSARLAIHRTGASGFQSDV